MYRIQNIGREFNSKSRAGLEKHLNEAEQEGWQLDTVFSVTEATCLGLSRAETYYMVLRRD